MDDFFSPSRRDDQSLFMRNSRSISVLSENSFSPSYRDESLYRLFRSKRYILSVTSPHRVRWDFLIMLSAVWNCFYVPFDLAFFSMSSYTALSVFNVIIDVIYILDILTNFRTTYIDSITGVEIRDPWLIASRYLKSGRFFLDAVAGIPFEIIDLIISSQSSTLRLLTLMKMIRLLRLSKIIMFMRTRDHVKLTLKLFHLFIIMLVYLHLQACLWFLLNCTNEEYVPPAFYVDKKLSLYTESALWSYAFSLYMSVYMLTAAEIGPRTEWERIVAGFFIIMGQLFQAYMFGEIAVVLFNLNIKSSRITEIQDAANTSMANMRLAPGLQRKISDFLVSTQGAITKQTEFEEFFKILPPSMKQEVRAFLFERVVMNHVTLGLHVELANSILHRLSNLYCLPEFNIVTQGEKAEALYFLISGKCEVEVLDETKQPHKVKKLKEGALFGEVALVYNTFRTATVRTIDYANIAILSKDDFSMVCHKFPKAIDLFRREATRYHDAWKTFLKTTLRRCPFFKAIPGKILNEVIYMLPTERVQPNTFIYKEGEVATRISFILDGKVEIYTPINDSRLAMFPSTDLFLREQTGSAKRIQFRRGSLQAMNKKKDTRYLLKMAMDDLGMGSVLCANLLLVHEKMNIYVKATETTTFLTLDLSLLKKLCLAYSEIKEQVEKHRQELFVFDTFSKTRRAIVSPLDYEKCFQYQVEGAGESLWRSRMRVKRLVMSKILNRRTARAKGMTDLLSMSRKLKAILEAEADGNYALSEKIRRGVIPTYSDNVGEALQLLNSTEVENPLMTQFAAEATKVGKVLNEVREQMYIIQNYENSLVTYRIKAKKKVADVQQLVLLAERLRKMRRC